MCHGIKWNHSKLKNKHPLKHYCILEMSEAETKLKSADDEDIEDLKNKISEMEGEMDELSKTQAVVDEKVSAAADSVDENSMYVKCCYDICTLIYSLTLATLSCFISFHSHSYVGQVDYEATVDELRAHFSPCGTINRITIKRDPRTNYPKGFCYIEFVEKEAVDKALKFDDTPFKGRQLKVSPKLKQQPIATRGGRGGGRGGRGRGGFYGGRGGSPYRGGGGRGFRGRGRGGFGRGRGGSYQPNYY